MPVDGVVEDGRSSLDEAMVTGESMPVTRTVGDQVIGGTLNQTGALVIRAEKVGRDTMLSRIVQMVADAQRSRAPIQRMADQVSGWFVPLVIVIAILAFIVWGIWGPEAFVGGPLALLRTGDIVELDIPARSLNVRITDAEMQARRAAWRRPEPLYERGYGALFSKHIEQADKGCDFDFLRTEYGGPTREPAIH